MPWKLERIMADGVCRTLNEHVEVLRRSGTLEVRELARA
jgi:hypothetical protein